MTSSVGVTTFPATTVYVRTDLTTGAITEAALEGSGKLIDDANLMKVIEIGDQARTGNIIEFIESGMFYASYTQGAMSIGEFSLAVALRNDNTLHRKLLALEPKPNAQLEIGTVSTTDTDELTVDYVQALFTGVNKQISQGDVTMVSFSFQPTLIWSSHDHA